MKMSNIIIDVDVLLGRPIFLWTYKKLGRCEILLKKKVNVKKKMDQKLVEENEPNEFKGPFIIVLKKIKRYRKR